MVRVSKADNVARKAIFLEGGLHARFVFLSPGNILTQNLQIPKVGEINRVPSSELFILVSLKAFISGWSWTETVVTLGKNITQSSD